MIGNSMPASRSSATMRRPTGLIARPDRPPKRFLSSGSPVSGSSRKPFTRVHHDQRRPRRTARRAARAPGSRSRATASAGPGGDSSDGACQHVFEDRLEREVDVVARDVELDRGDLAGRRVPLTTSTRRAESSAEKPPTEMIRFSGASSGSSRGSRPRCRYCDQPKAFSQPPSTRRSARPYSLQQFGSSVESPVLAQREVARARLERQRARGHRAEAFQRHPLRERTQAVQGQAAARRAVAEQAGRRHHPIAQADAVQIEHRAL